MTMVERIASAIAASRTGTTAGWQFYRDDALRMIAAARDFRSLRARRVGDVRHDRPPHAG
ncbi:hypothetical protein [Sphingomonas psychrotolerans]|uniref:Uncharacterized protein n=1 Tax=Sphingomonas psychrotolerans TaxID=1327635 RepID=A0A2K8MHX4_9SPHN|nr:hypothetical protein [Sphingomonas psychrotolerans]ATY33485.1 hypothetical protein CVN68_17195 [Sphingomonas psychrotolerans]